MLQFAEKGNGAPRRRPPVTTTPTRGPDPDIHLWHAFKTNPGKETFNPLYNQMKPFIDRAIYKHKLNSGIPGTAFDIQAADQFLKTVNTFDPNKGSWLRDKVAIDSQKASRLNYQYQNLGRIPENRATQVGNLRRAQDHLRNFLGREPTVTELADEMGIPKSDVVLLLKELRADLTEGQTKGLEAHYMNFEDPEEQKMMQIIYYELSPLDQNVFDFLTGSHGRPRLMKGNKPDYDKIAKECRVTTKDVYLSRDRIQNKIRSLRKHM